MSKIKPLVVLGIVVIALALLAFYGRNFFKATPDNAGVLAPVSQKQPSVDENQARLKVKDRTEVVKYETDLVRLGSKAEIEVEDLGEDWNVHVFEIVINDDGSSHTATFGWYRVNKTTGKIERDI